MKKEISLNVFKCAIIILKPEFKDNDTLNFINPIIDDLKSNKIYNIKIFAYQNFDKTKIDYYNNNQLNIEFIKTTTGNLSVIKDISYSCNTDYIVINFNRYIPLDYNKIYNKHKNDNNNLTMVCGIKIIKIPYDAVETDNLGRIKYFEENPSFTFTINLNVYIINSDIISTLKNYNDLSARKLLNICANNKKKIGTFIHGGTL